MNVKEFKIGDLVAICTNNGIIETPYKVIEITKVGNYKIKSTKADSNNTYIVEKNLTIRGTKNAHLPSWTAKSYDEDIKRMFYKKTLRQEIEKTDLKKLSLEQLEKIIEIIKEGK